MIYDPIRQLYVARTPEEEVRQQWIRELLLEGYPPSLMAVEKELRTLPHLSSFPLGEVPKRRADIIVFAKDSRHALSPLLMIECKVAPLTASFKRQVIGYNGVVGAPFVAIANLKTLLLGAYQPSLGSFLFEEGLKSYQKLLELCQA